MSRVVRFKDQNDFYKQMKGTHCRINPGIVRDVEKPSAAPIAKPAPAKKEDSQGSELEELLAEKITAAGLPEPTRQYLFLRGSKHTLDFAWPQHRINGMQFGVEVQGMVHRIKSRFSADLEKRARALQQDWMVLEVGGEQIRTGKAIEWISERLQRATTS